MLRSPFVRWTLGALVVVIALGVVRLRPWSRPAAPAASTTTAREALAVGFLPVTCHLTCPVTDYATRTSASTRFESQRFTDFPTVVETLKSGRLDATFMIAPLAMKLREQGVRVKIVYLGHRDGSTVMVRNDLAATSLKDLAGRTFAIPSKYSNQNLVIRKLMQDEGVDPATIRFVEMPPPDMPGRTGEQGHRRILRGRAACRARGARWLRSRAVSRQGHLAALHLLRARRHREADRTSVRTSCATSCVASRKAASGPSSTASRRRPSSRRTSGRTRNWCVTC